MEKLIKISGFVNSEIDLLKIDADEGDYYNVLSPAPFMTYKKTNDPEICNLMQTTDIIGWFENFAELESYITKPNYGDIYITDDTAPFTRWKCNINTEGKYEWIEDGKSDIKILRKFTSEKLLNNANLIPEPELFYSVGKKAPYNLYGTVKSWEPVGMYISLIGDNFQKIQYLGFSIGEIAFIDGLLWLFTKDGWKELDYIEPLENYKKHIYHEKKSNRIYKIREGFKLGTLEFFTPKEWQ